MLAHLSIFCPITQCEEKLGWITELAESVRLLYSLSTEFTKYASRIYDCSQILKFCLTLTSWYLNTLIFVVSVIVQCASGEGRYYGGRSCFSSYQQSKKSILLIVVFLTLTVKNPPAIELRDTLKAMNSVWQRLAQTKRFKGVVKGFIRTTEVTRGKDGDMMAHPHFHALLLVDSSYFARNYIKQLEWVEMYKGIKGRLCPIGQRKSR